MKSLIPDTWEELRDRWIRGGRVCGECGSTNYGFVLKNEEWAKIARKDELLCEECSNKRWGDEIPQEAHLPCPWNTLKLAYNNFYRGKK